LVLSFSASAQLNMNDRAPIRDRTLILRILVPGLEARLRDKMKETEEEYTGSSTNGGASAPGSMNNSNKERILDLEGVTCEPTSARNHTLWNFHCDGATYPAKLVNLPCPVELHKTHDHAAYYKSVDIAQMLIVYEDEMALEEADEKPIEGYPSYHHSGLTPPTRRIVERRFAAREHDAKPPPRAAVLDVENEIVKLMEQIATTEKAASASNKRTKVPLLTSANKVFEEVHEDIVDYEPWMNDFGRQSAGVEFDADDQQCSLHPEVWLRPEDIRAIKEVEDGERKKKQAAADKKEAKRSAKKLEKEAVSVKKGIPSKKSAAAAAAAAAAVALPNHMVDDVTAAAAMMVSEGANDEDLLDDDNILDFDLEGDDFMKDLNLNL
jgi:transcription initiation factor TFIID subunit 7